MTVDKIENIDSDTKVGCIEIPESLKLTDLLVAPDGKIMISAINKISQMYEVIEVNTSGINWSNPVWGNSIRVDLNECLCSTSFKKSVFRIKKILQSSEVIVTAAKYFKLLRANNRNFVSIIDGVKFRVFE